MIEILAASKIRGIGPTMLRRALHLSSDRAGLNKSILENILKREIQNQEYSTACKWAEQQIDRCKVESVSILHIGGVNYPKALENVSDAPPVIYAKGNLEALSKISCGVIGTRDPTEHGKIIASRITEFLLSRKFSIVSGLAIGCDTIAHKVTVDNNEFGIAVLAHGLHQIYPKQNEKLAHDLLDNGGLLISEYPLGTPPSISSFVKRDRIQAGLSAGVVMIQSGLKGGSLHASRAIIEYNRCLFVPSPTTRDINENIAKVMANHILSNGVIEEKMDILKCTKDSLKYLRSIRSKNDYGMFDELFEKIFINSEAQQNMKL